MPRRAVWSSPHRRLPGQVSCDARTSVTSHAHSAMQGRVAHRTLGKLTLPLHPGR